jgi:hypothetical protein
MTPSLTPTVSYIFYANTEYDVAAEGIFLDNNVYIRKNPSTDLVNDVFSTPSLSMPITGSVIYQGDSIYAQSQGFTGGYPAPTYGTATRTLTVTDSALNTLYNFTGDYTTYSNINTTFSIVGGRNYFVRGRTDFAWPANATLNLGGLYDGGAGYYLFSYTLSDAVEGDFTMNTNGMAADVYFTNCSGPSEDTIYNNASATVTQGQYGLGNISTGYSTTYAFNYYKLNNYVYIDGDYYQNGSTSVRGATTVTVSLSTDCTPL